MREKKKKVKKRIKLKLTKKFEWCIRKKIPIPKPLLPLELQNPTHAGT